MSARRPTLKDVATMAGVSISTVSRVWREHPDVSQETRDKVAAAIDQLGYFPSALAQGLVSGRSMTLGVLVSDITSLFYPAMVAAIEQVSSERGYVVFLCNTGDLPDRSLHYVDRLLAHGVDGVLHASIGDDEDVLDLLLERSIPVVVANRRPTLHSHVDVVTFDSFGGARLATRHLIELGHKRIALIVGHAHVSTILDRARGFEAEMKLAGLSCLPECIVHTDITRDAGYRSAMQLLQQSPRPTALIAFDLLAYGVLDAAYELQLAVPAQLSLVSLGVTDTSILGRLQLTTVSSEIELIGRVACERLIDLIENPHAGEPVENVLKVHLIERGTTAHVPSSR